MPFNTEIVGNLCPQLPLTLGLFCPLQAAPHHPRLQSKHALFAAAVKWARPCLRLAFRMHIRVVQSALHVLFLHMVGNQEHMLHSFMMKAFCTLQFFRECKEVLLKGRKSPTHSRGSAL